METLGTQPMKDDNDERNTSAENEGQDDESDHHQDWSKWDPELRQRVHEPAFEGPLGDPVLEAEVRAACHRAHDFYGTHIHSDVDDLERRLIRRFGRVLRLYPAVANRETALEKLAINLLIRNGK